MRHRPLSLIIVPFAAALLGLSACDRNGDEELPAPAATPPGGGTDLPTEDDMSPGAERLAPPLSEAEGEPGDEQDEAADPTMENDT